MAFTVIMAAIQILLHFVSRTMVVLVASQILAGFAAQILGRMIASRRQVAKNLH